ncbi:hypothetical protein [Nodularia spumigena]|jgi:hypothetical protein|uniref:hypothetical protein n=1 Tax=Nodularia spumigena TaxID=70799 RepID=UPI002B208BB1|nr:hypothetical protein [Nodularia spumigena]MEA5558189.1 hypothetical protein [Nodularia spumigena CH309]
MSQHNKIQEIMGVKEGEHFASKELNLKPIQIDKHRGTRPQGFDAVYKNPKTGNLVVVDFKGGPSSKLKSNQKRMAYLNKAANRTLRSQTATLREKRSAALVKGRLAQGKTVEFMAVKTPTSGKTHVSHHSFCVKPANSGIKPTNSKEANRPQLDHKKVSNFNRATVYGWQQQPSRKISRAANDNSRTPPSPKQSTPQQSQKRGR